MAQFRRQRLADQLLMELADLMQREIRDPRLGFVTVTEVRMSRDLKYARVYVSILGDEDERTESMGVLERARGFLRTRIGRRMDLRLVPELRFVIDDTLATSARIDALLDAGRVSDGADVLEAAAALDGDGAGREAESKPHESERGASDGGVSGHDEADQAATARGENDDGR